MNLISRALLSAITRPVSLLGYIILINKATQETVDHQYIYLDCKPDILYLASLTCLREMK